MMKRIVIIWSILQFSFNMSAQCTNTTDRVLLIGDSWAAFAWEFDAHNIVFDKFGLPDQRAYSTGAIASATSETDLVQSGKRARNFMDSTKKVKIAEAFVSHPSIDIVHLSLFGNDYLGEWDTTWTNAQIDTYTNEVFDSIMSVYNYIQLQKPGVKVLLSGYDYPNFEESINDLFLPSQHPFYNTWVDMLKPSFYQINSLLDYLQPKIDSMVNQHTNFYFVNNLGIMQYSFGQTYNLPYAPGGAYPSHTAPLPGGYIHYPSPMASMNDYLGIKDAFHLSPEGFEYFVGNQTKEFYFEALRKYDATTVADTIGSGSIDANINVSDSLVLGKVNGIEHTSYLTFVLPALDATRDVGWFSLFLKMKNKYGARPTVDLEVGIVNGKIGANFLLQTDDFQTTFANPIVPCQFGSLSADDYWLRLDLEPAAIATYSTGDTVQLQINYTGLDTVSNQALRFYLNEGVASQPILDIHYQSPIGIFEKEINTKIAVFPNPTEGVSLLKLDSDFKGVVQLHNTMGQLIQKITVSNQSQIEINLSHYPKGVYLITINDNNGKIRTAKLLKY